MGDGSYQPFYYKESLGPADIEITDDMYIVIRETAESYLQQQALAKSEAQVKAVKEPGPTLETRIAGEDTAVTSEIDSVTLPKRGKTGPLPIVTKDSKSLIWQGEIDPQKWVNFYMKILTKFASNHDLKLSLQVEISGGDGISEQKIEEMKSALRELGLDDDVIVDWNGMLP